MIKISTFALVVLLVLPVAVAHGAINSLNGSTSSTQVFATTTNAHLSVKTVNGTHTFDWAGILQPTQGGTGLSSISLGDLLYGSATNTLSALGIDTIATRYLSNTGPSSTPKWAQINLSNGVTSTLSVTNGGTGANLSIQAGDILIAVDPTHFARLAKGSEGQVLMVSSTASSNVGGIAWVTLATSTASSSKVEISDGSVKALYHLEGTTDSSGNSFNLTNTGSVAFNAGKLSNAADTGASNSTKYLSVANNLTLFTATGTITLGGWFNFTTLPTGTQVQTLFYHGNSVENCYEVIDYYANSGSPLLRYYRNCNGGALDGYNKSVSLSTGTWYHAALSWDGSSKRLRSWYNGAQDNQTIGTSGTGTGGVPSEAGIFEQSTGSALMSGLADEVFFLNKEISTTTMSSIYNGGSGKEICTTVGC